MLRITRRDFLKYCSVAAGALGLSASTMMRVESVLAKQDGTGTPVIWIAGAACTGCTMTLLNSVFYTTVEELLLDRINLNYLDTAMAACGSYVDGQLYGGANAITEARAMLTGTNPFVLVVEGAIPTATPNGGAAGDYCRIGSLAPGKDNMLEVTTEFANNANCVAILSVGTCASFGGIPGAQGNVTSAKGVGFSGTAKGGAIISDTGVGGAIQAIKVTNGGSGYTGAVTATLTGGGGSGANTLVRTVGPITGFSSIVGGTGYTSGANVAVNVLGVCTTRASVQATVVSGVITALTLVSPNFGGAGYSTVSGEVTVDIDSTDGKGTGASALATVTGASVASVSLVAPGFGGTGYTSAPTVTFSTGTGATAVAAVTGRKAITNRSGLAAKLINISGCPPHPDWIVGTIAHILDTNITLPSINPTYQPVGYGYGEYQCNAGPCQWRYNNATDRPDHNARYPVGDSQKLGKYKYALTDTNTPAQGCLGIMGCKGRKTKADCSRRRWNTADAGHYGVNWCVGSRSGCHGCTQPAFPDKVGKFFTFI